MRGIIKEGRFPGCKYVEDLPVPMPKPDEIQFKVKAAAICGTDYGFWLWNKSGERFADKYEMKLPYTLGHECSGVVTAVGENVKTVAVGDRIALETHIYCGECYQCKTGNAHNCQHLKIYGTSCDGSFAEYAVAPEKIVFKLPDEVSYEEAALFEPAGVAMFGLQEADVQPGDVVLIYGCGPIGQMTISLAKARGAREVIALDINDYKAGLATKLGAIGVNSMTQDVKAIVREVAGERGGVDVIVEVSGAASVYDTMADYLRPEGRIVLLAHPGEMISMDVMRTMHHSGATIKGCFGRRIWGSWTELTDLVVSGKVDLTKVITHRFPLSAATEAFETIQKGSGKVLFLPEQE